MGHSSYTLTGALLNVRKRFDSSGVMMFTVTWTYSWSNIEVDNITEEKQQATFRQYHLCHVARKPILGDSDQVRYKLDCTATKDG